MEWKTSWSYLPIDYGTTIGTIENITQKTTVWNNLNAEKIKIRFSNQYGREDLVIEKAILLVDQKKVPLTYKGSTKITIGSLESFYSDECMLSVTAGQKLEIRLYIKEKTKIQSACSTWAAKSWQTVYGLDGDFTENDAFTPVESRAVFPYVEADVNKANIVFGISEIKAFTRDTVRTIALFGDSITHMSYYSDALMENLYQNYPGSVTVINRGIGGNRVLHDASVVKDMPGEGKCFGIAATKRFVSDVYDLDCPEDIVILEGINDMMHPYVFQKPEEIVTARDLEGAIEEFVNVAHGRGSRVYLGSVMPFRNDSMEWLPEAEGCRVSFNDWIRKQTIADGVIDFSKAIEEEERPQYMKEGFHIGDGLHPNEAGGAVMAKAAYEVLFKTN
ncbi:MAG: hypothetical protein PWP24_1537 [Clostridiales bacterium]|nr:hypothetical protein [Clostridiales bacterium]